MASFTLGHGVHVLPRLQGGGGTTVIYAFDATVVDPDPLLRGGMYDFKLTKGDRSPSIRRLVQNADESAFDFTGWATPTFSMWPVGDSTPVIDAATADFDGALTEGTLIYNWAAADVANAGHFIAKFTVTTPGGVTQSFPRGKFLSVYIADET